MTPLPQRLKRVLDAAHSWDVPADCSVALAECGPATILATLRVSESNAVRELYFTVEDRKPRILRRLHNAYLSLANARDQQRRDLENSSGMLLTKGLANIMEGLPPGAPRTALRPMAPLPGAASVAEVLAGVNRSLAYYVSGWSPEQFREAADKFEACAEELRARAGEMLHVE